MTASEPTRKPPRPSLIDRRIEKIANARSVTLGLAVSFVLLALAGAVVIRIVDHKDFSSPGLALWWALQTMTTVGYGDVVPTTNVGRLIGGIEMVLGVSFIAFLTAGVTSTVVHRAGEQADEAEREHRARDSEAIVDALIETRAAIAELDSRLERIESKLTG